jgi:chromosome segregation ATPase
MRQAVNAIVLILALVVFMLTGCGQEVKRENEQLKSQVGTLEKENTQLKGQVTTLKADTDALKQQLDGLTKEKGDLEQKLKEAEAKLAARPGAKPPLRSKRSS